MKVRRRFPVRGKRIPLLMLAVCALVTGCSNSAPDRSLATKPNPHPTAKYEIVVDVGDFPTDRVEGRAEFNIQNADGCTPIDPKLGGSHDHHSQYVPFAFKRVDAHRFSAILVRDPFLSEDYFGFGTCNWDFTAANIGIKKGTPDQIAMLSRNELAPSSDMRISEQYCPTEVHYSGQPPPIDLCNTNLQGMPEARRRYLTRVTIGNRKLAP
jgi:hypothetical protein